MNRSLLLLSVLMTSTTLAADWPQWRGVNRDESSTESGLLKSWPEGGPKQLWLNKDAGLGYSSFAVVGGVLYTLGAFDAEEKVIAIDAATGEQKWATTIGPLLSNGWGGGPRSAPTVVEGRVYAMSGKGHLACLDTATGDEKWVTEMENLGGKVPNWGYTESPLVVDGLVICTPGGKSGTVAALDGATGKVVWQSKDWDDAAQYSSAISVMHEGKKQIIQLTMKHVAGIDAADGSVLWKVEFPGQTAVIPTPIFHDGQVFVAAGYKVGCLSATVGADSAEILYSNTDMVNHHGGVILHEGHLYGYSDGGGWTCMDFKTGAVKWAEKKALGKGAIHYADGHFYLLEESSGTVVLIDASSEGWSEKSRFTLEPQSEERSAKGKVWTHPVVSEGRLYLRDQELLFCFDVVAK